MNQSDIAVSIPFPGESAPEPGEDDIVKLSSHIDCILGNVSCGQPGLPSGQPLLVLQVKQITAFLG